MLTEMLSEGDGKQELLPPADDVSLTSPPGNRDGLSLRG